MGVSSTNLIKRKTIGSAGLVQASGQSSFIFFSYWLSEKVYIEDLTQEVSRCCVNFQHIAAKQSKTRVFELLEMPEMFVKASKKTCVWFDWQPTAAIFTFCWLNDPRKYLCWQTCRCKMGKLIEAKAGRKLLSPLPLGMCGCSHI